MHANDQDDAGTAAASNTTAEDARRIIKMEIADAIAVIVDRDPFLQRLARRVAELTGTDRVAIYTRSSPSGDLMLSTLR